jgi:hypothetical protein
MYNIIFIIYKFHNFHCTHLSTHMDEITTVLLHKGKDKEVKTIVLCNCALLLRAETCTN